MTSTKPRFGLVPNPNEQKIVRAAIKEILEVCKRHINKPLKSISVLDAGSGRGEYAAEIAKHVKNVVGVEPQANAFDDAKSRHKRIKNLKFYKSLIEDFKTTEKFDLIISLTVFEHMPDQKKSFKRMLELLKNDGIIYLTAPNKYWVFEQHYGLPFLSWLPLPLANFYLRLTKNVDSYKDCSYSLGYFGMKKFFDKFKCSYKFVLPFNPESVYYGCATGNSANIRKFGIKLIRLHPIFWSLSKGFIIVIRKNDN